MALQRADVGHALRFSAFNLRQALVIAEQGASAWKFSNAG
jgi:hypothetical protein